MFKFYKVGGDITVCHNIQTLREPTKEELDTIRSLIQPDIDSVNHTDFIEWGTHLTTVTPWSSNAMSIFEKCGVACIGRIELSYLAPKDKFNLGMIDPMTQTVYEGPLTTFEVGVTEPTKHRTVSSIALENKEQKLGFDQTDLEFYQKLYSDLGRDPTDVELWDLAQSNSEHSRHWFFNGRLIKEDGTEVEQSLFKMVKNTQNSSNGASLIAFSDNSSAIRFGKPVQTLFPKNRDYVLTERKLHPMLTAETHNFPTGVAPFPGAATGTGGRIRDNQAIGRGGYVVAGNAGYCVGSVVDGPYLEKNTRTLIRASDGASDYGNKFGEPVIGGFCRTFGMDVEYSDGSISRREWVKPIMFSAGVGTIDDELTEKRDPEPGMLVVKLGGPAYKIGIGGGAASSRGHDTKNKNQDMNAVQRGDPQMENKLNRVVRACVEMGSSNPIQSIHDQGAGGTANVTKEIAYPQGVDVYLDRIPLGDPSMSALEIWVSEYQEQDTVLIYPKDLQLVQAIGERENLPVATIGTITGYGRIRVYDRDGDIVEDLPLEPILGTEMPRKEYQLARDTRVPLNRNVNGDLFDQLISVLSQPSVGSKRFLTSKVDRSVTGLVAQQQCVGPLHTPLADYSVTAHSHFDLTGTVTSIGEQPIKGLVDPQKMGRLAVGEMLTNMIWAKVTSTGDIRCSGNWMWPNKKAVEKDALYQACEAMCDTVAKLGFAFDGGKDSLSMTYTDSETGKTVDAPRSLVVTGYCPMSDVRQKVTPDLKDPNNPIYFVDMANGKQRMGASALNVANGFLGDDCPDLEDPQLMLRVWATVQEFISQGVILSGHDRSDGGLMTAVCEMAFAGNLGLELDFSAIPTTNLFQSLFNEELGLVVEVAPQHVELFEERLSDCAYRIGTTVSTDTITVIGVGSLTMTELRNSWEKPSYEFDYLQTNPRCVDQEYAGYLSHSNPRYRLAKTIDLSHSTEPGKYRVAIIREEGSNGDREMAAAFRMAGFSVHDICMNDLICDETLTLDQFRGIAFVGGFSYADVFGAGRGWYHVIKTHSRIREEFRKFYEREDTFSLGVCNGCQLMAQLGWIPECTLEPNKSGRFESRFPTVRINRTNAVMLRGLRESQLGIWVAHGEGQFSFPKGINSTNIAVQQINSDGLPTTTYPDNPNGSPFGIAALTSDNGRHLAMMPHPERCFLRWQMPYSQKEIEVDEKYSPWFQLFLNAYRWCAMGEVNSTN